MLDTRCSYCVVRILAVLRPSQQVVLRPFDCAPFGFTQGRQDRIVGEVKAESGKWKATVENSKVEKTEDLRQKTEEPPQRIAFSELEIRANDYFDTD